MRKPLTIGACEAKQTLSQLLDRVENGELFVITRHGVPVARLGPCAAARRTRTAGRSLRGLLRLRAEFLKQNAGLTLDEILRSVGKGRR